MASRRAFLSLRLAILAAACGLGMTAAASGAAAAALAQPDGDPPGANGTVKIDFTPADASRANRPHVTCPFDAQFFGFDPGQTGDITVVAHPPSGRTLVAARAGVALTPSGAATTFTEADLDLAGLEEHPQQGFHLKLTVTVEEDGKTFKKSKVFWLKCARPTTPPPTTKPPTTKPPTKAPPLPVTGTSGIGGLAAVGLALVTGGALLLVLRRRRDDLSISD